MQSFFPNASKNQRWRDDENRNSHGHPRRKINGLMTALLVPLLPLLQRWIQ